MLAHALLCGGALGGWLALVLVYTLMKRTSQEYIWWLITG